MLVLTRRVGEKIRIADDIHVQIVEISGNRVYLGITAPSEVRVDREEVHQRRLSWAVNEESRSPRSRRSGALARVRQLSTESCSVASGGSSDETRDLCNGHP